MKHVFISYVREDVDKVQAIKAFLEKEGVRVWLDRTSLFPGKNWKESIADAIEKGAFFLACFSQNYANRETTYMDEEVALAIQQLRQTPDATNWLVPLRLSPCEIPDMPIGDGKSLSDLQAVDFFPDFQHGLDLLSAAILPMIKPREFLYRELHRLLTYHVTEKIKLFQKTGARRFREIEQKWLELTEESRFDHVFEAFLAALLRAQSTRDHEYERLVEPTQTGRIIIVSIVPHQDMARFVESLAPRNKISGHPYVDFILDQKRDLRKLPNWQHRDFVHVLYFVGEEGMLDDLLDMLYLPDFRLTLSLTSQLLRAERRSDQPGSLTATGWECLYPGTCLNAVDATSMFNLVNKEDAEAFQKQR